MSMDNDPIRSNGLERHGYIYLVQCDKYYKIGYAKHLGSRVSSLRVSNPFPLELLHYTYVPNARLAEEELHSEFIMKIHRGEWFTLSASDVQKAKLMMIEYGKQTNV